MKTKIRFGKGKVLITHDTKSVSSYEGDEILTKIIKPEFEKEITVLQGSESGITEKILRPKDEGYVEAVLIEKVRNEEGMRIVH